MAVTEIISQMLQLDTMSLFIVLFLLIIIAYKLFKYLMKVFMTGMVFALFPIIANLIGIPVPLTFQSVMWSALFGIMAYLVYSMARMGLKVVSIVLSPFKRMFKKKPKVEKVIIKEVEKKDKKGD